MSNHVVKKYVYSFSENNKPALRVEQGETIALETLDCFSNQIKSENDLLTSVDFSKVNPATGPVYVNGAEQGDLLVVDILDVDVADQGVGINAPETGPLHDKVTNRTKIIEIQNGMVKYNDMTFLVNPMIGVIEVAPKGEKVPSGFPGAHD